MDVLEQKSSVQSSNGQCRVCVVTRLRHWTLTHHQVVDWHYIRYSRLPDGNHSGRWWYVNR